jgi:hypothetical protein
VGGGHNSRVVVHFKSLRCVSMLKHSVVCRAWGYDRSHLLRFLAIAYKTGNLSVECYFTMRISEGNFLLYKNMDTKTDMGVDYVLVHVHTHLHALFHAT